MDTFKITITPEDLSQFTDSREAVRAIVAKVLNIRQHVVNVYTDRQTLLVCTNIGTSDHVDYHMPDRLARLISQTRNGKALTAPRTFTLRRTTA